MERICWTLPGHSGHAIGTHSTGENSLEQDGFAAFLPAGKPIQFDWDWIRPYLSILLAPDGQVSSIMVSRDKYPWVFDPLNLTNLPHLKKATWTTAHIPKPFRNRESLSQNHESCL
jgi:hypothetical protein